VRDAARLREAVAAASAVPSEAALASDCGGEAAEAGVRV
jgi:hypothetical protein